MDNNTSIIINDNVNVTDVAYHIELDLRARLWPLYVTSAIIVTIIGVIGNILVIHAIKSNKKLHTVSSVLILNLAVSDIVFLLLCPFFFAFMTESTWSQNEAAVFGCRLFYYVLHSSLYAAIYSLVAIAMIRYIAIAHEAKTRHLRTRKNCFIMVTVIWILILLCNIPIFYSYTVIEWYGHTFCYPLDDDLGTKIGIVFFTVSYVIPLLLISLVSMVTHISMSGTVLDETSCLQRRRRASRLLCIVVVAFALFWLPVQVDQMLTFFSVEPFTVHYELIRSFFFLLAFSNSAINPIIYNFTSQNFRQAFKEVLGVSGRDKVTPDVTKTTTTQLHNRSIKQLPYSVDIRVFKVQVETNTLLNNLDAI